MKLALMTPAAVAALLLGCSTNVPVVTKSGSAGLSGSYRFEGTGRIRPDQLPNPLIDWADIAIPSTLELHQANNEQIHARYINRGGKLVERLVVLSDTSAGVTFKNGELSFVKRLPILDARILPGFSRQFAGTRFFKNEDGNLHVVGFFKEAGLALFLFPFSDHDEYELIVKADSR